MLPSDTQGCHSGWGSREGDRGLTPEECVCVCVYLGVSQAARSLGVDAVLQDALTDVVDRLGQTSLSGNTHTHRDRDRLAIKPLYTCNEHILPHCLIQPDILNNKKVKGMSHNCPLVSARVLTISRKTDFWIFQKKDYKPKRCCNTPSESHVSFMLQRPAN